MEKGGNLVLKVVFAHDHFFVKDADNFYSSSGSFTTQVIERYDRIFDHVDLLTRQKELSEKQDSQILSLIRVKNASFIEVPNFKSFTMYHRRISEAKKIIEASVKANDCLIARLPSSIGAIAIHYAQKHQKPYLVELVGCPWDALWNYGSLLGKLIAPFTYLKTKRLVRNSKYVIYVSNVFLQRRYPTKGKSIGCSDVSIPEPDEKVLQKRLDKIRSRKEDDPLILGTAAGINVKYKGQQYVIKALSKLVKLGYNVEYHLAGAGTKEYLTSVAEKCGVIDRVKFLGSIPREGMFDYFDSLDIYVQPSKQEGLPRALVEAMSVGCPAIGSMTGGIPELLDDEFIFQNGSVRDIVGIIRKLEIREMEEQAKTNFEKAREYRSDVLEKRRESFLREFRRSIQQSQSAW